MRRSSRLLDVMNWRYAIGEVMLIFVGISLALAANAWYEQRGERRDEIALLSQLEASLARDIETVERAHETILGVDQRIADFVDTEDLASLTSEALSDGVGSLNRFIVLNVRYGPYETLKARGLGLISNRALRVKISSLYEDEIPLLIEDSRIDYRLAREQNLPVMLNWFWLDDAGNWVVKTPDSDEWHEELRTLGRYRAGTYRAFYLPAYERALESMRDVRVDIRAELSALAD
jgi:hypothetical protein